MIDWLKSLTPETIIIISALITIFIMTIFTLIRLRRIASRVGEQDFYINESLVELDGQPYINITVINKAFSTNHINVIGMELRNISHPLEEKVVMIAARSKHQTRFKLNELEPIIFQNRKKYRPFRIYVENKIGLRKSFRPRVNNRFMKRKFKQLLKSQKRERKLKRIETGQYNFFERTGLIVGLLFRPFIKLKRHMALSTNKALRESEVRRLQKKEHDILKYKLDQDEFELDEIRIREQAVRENRTRELELETLKKSKELEIEKIKQLTRQAELQAAKAELEAINPEVVAKKELATENESKAKEDKKRKSKEAEVATVGDVVKTTTKDKVEKPLKDTSIEGVTGVERKAVTEKPKKPRAKKAKPEQNDVKVTDLKTKTNPKEIKKD